MSSSATEIKAGRDGRHLKDLTEQFPKRVDLQRDHGWQGQINILEKEHENLSALLYELDREAQKLLPKKVPDYHLLEDILHYLSHYADEYHHSRENLIFSKALSKGANKSALDQLEREHLELASLSGSILHTISNITGGSPADRPALLQDLTRYVERYGQHMAFESRDIFPLATGTFSDPEWESIKAKTRFVDDPLFGDDIHFRYKRLSASLRDEIRGFSDIYRKENTSCIQSILLGFSSFITMPYRIANALSPFRRK
jgi:hemerythrin-like domain-containing protein